VADPSKHESSTCLRGKLLLADPSLRGSIFHRSVILIHDHGAAEGAMGLILNQPTGKAVGDFLRAEEFSALRQVAVHVGGPVDGNQLTFSSFWWSANGGLRWAIRLSPQQAADHMRRPGRLVRAFIGYSGWSAGQLEGELEQPSWITLDPEASLLGAQHDPGLWGELLAALSPLHRLMAMSPEDLFLN